MHERSSLTASGSGVWYRRNRAGASALTVLAGILLFCAGTTAAALAAADSAAGATSSQVCQTLPSSPLGGLHLAPLRLVRSVLHKLDRALGASPSPSPSPTPGPVQLCISVQAVTGTAQPGQVAAYRIRVWPSGGAVGNVTVQASLTTGRASPPFRAPTFNFCGNGDGTATCAVGTMQPPQASDLQVQAAVPSAAPAGDSATLTATVTGAASQAGKPGQATTAATVSIVAAPPTSRRPAPTHSHSSSSGHGKQHGSTGGGGTGLQPVSLPSLSSPSGSTTAGDPAIEFPAITPVPDPAPVQPSRSAKATHGPYRASEAANIVPLNAGELGGQVAGLIVLVLGVALVLMRVSVRGPAQPRDDQRADGS
ncbi:MAG TPA: hypothetical protein VGI74_17180 [Streptosporangiaceae bacterium]